MSNNWTYAVTFTDRENEVWEMDGLPSAAASLAVALDCLGRTVADAKRRHPGGYSLAPDRSYRDDALLLTFQVARYDDVGDDADWSLGGGVRAGVQRWLLGTWTRRCGRGRT